jgi:hypothetical protein
VTLKWYFFFLFFSSFHIHNKLQQNVVKLFAKTAKGKVSFICWCFNSTAAVSYF